MENESQDMKNLYYCTNCGKEVAEDTKKCPNCGAELDSFEEDEDKENTIVIRTYMNEFEAEIAKGALDEEGIPAFISKDDEGSMIPALDFSSGVKLHVFEKDINKADEIIKSLESAGDSETTSD